MYKRSCTALQNVQVEGTKCTGATLLVEVADGRRQRELGLEHACYFAVRWWPHAGIVVRITADADVHNGSLLAALLNNNRLGKKDVAR